MSLKGELPRRWPGMQKIVRGAGMSAGGKVFISLIPGKVTQGKVAPLIYQPDKFAGLWMPVEVPGSVLSVAGTEGGGLLTVNRGSNVDWLPID